MGHLCLLRSRTSHPPDSGDSEHPLTSEIDVPSHSSYFSQRKPRRPRRSATLPFQERIWKGTITYPLYLPTDRPPLPAPQPRTFAILETLPGMNPWDLGSRWMNFKAVMGNQLHDWLLPVRHSPCCDHTSTVSQYPLGPDFQELLIEAGLAPRPASNSPREVCARHFFSQCHFSPATTKAEAGRWLAKWRTARWLDERKGSQKNA